jgi:hypothetical protein
VKISAVSTLSNSRTSLFVLGIFFLVWSINGFFIGGELLKYLLLFLGFSLILGTTLFSLPRNSSFFRFASITFIVLLAFWFVAILLNQTTAQTNIVLFDVICYLLFISGYLVAKNLERFTRVTNITILFIVLLTVLGCVMYIKYQSMLSLSDSLSSSRDVTEGGDEAGINVIGVSYTNAIIFFIIYYFLSFYQLKKAIKIALLFSIFLTFFLILYTQSRGALIYIVLIVILDNLKKINTLTKGLKYTFKFLIILFFLAILIIKSIELNPAFAQKFQGTLDRFQLFLDVTEDIEADPSTYQRTVFLNKFINEIDSIILFGQEKYQPYPHNQFAEILMRWGFFLGLPLILISLTSLIKSVRISTKTISLNPMIHLMALLFLFSFLQSMSSMSLEMNRLFWLAMGFLIALPKLNVSLQNSKIII